MPIDRAIFREYDIRGVADRDLPDALAEALGRALAGAIGAARSSGAGGAGGAARPRLAVGRDCRLTSSRLRDALVAGALRGGLDVIDVGVVPTPMLYFAGFELATDGAVIVTGSHNPAADNGFKMMVGTTTLHGAEIQALATAVERGELPDVPAERRGGVADHDIMPAYLAHAARMLRLGERRCKVVVDAGNGAGGPAAVALYRQLGFEVVPLYCTMDGRFPNHHPDPTVPENLAELRAAVAREGAELGLAFDGDADRLGAVDGHGRILWGDQLLLLLGRALLAERPGATIIGDVKCSQVVFDELARAGATPVMARVGHSLIKLELKTRDAALAGEMSGHIFFAHRYLGFDDAIYAGARLLEVLSRGSRTLAALHDDLPRVINTPEIRVPCPDAIKFAVVEAVTARLRVASGVRGVVDLDGARADFGDGWGLVRASNTQAVLVVRAEARTAERLDAIRALLDHEIARARAALEDAR